MDKDKVFDVIIVGGGFYGLRLALFAYEELKFKHILVVEKESTMLSRASYVNQARVHNGYHYPRSILTAYRSSVNFPRFVKEYGPAVVDDFDKYYAISKQLSKVNARQFYEFSKKIGADITPAPNAIKKMFTTSLTDGVFAVKEYAFDSHKLRDLILERIKMSPGIKIANSEEVLTVGKNPEGLVVTTDKHVYAARSVFNCAYSRINLLHRRSNLPLVGLKHEIAEMCLVSLPRELRDFSVTMMDGPFFSIVPFPSRGLHTLSHVRYTPHTSWSDDADTPDTLRDAHEYFERVIRKTNYAKMRADVVRFIPALAGMRYEESIAEVKTVLTKSESDDSRPILFRPDHGLPGYTCIMGGKLDNIYDVFDELRKVYG